MAESGVSKATDKPKIFVRPATETDIPSIGTIGAYYVLNTVSTFRYTPATNEELLEAFRSVKQDHLPYLVATEKASNAILGYCYASRIRPSNLGYRHTVELSIYCKPEHVSKGIGGRLLKELLLILEDTKKSAGDGSEEGKVEVRSLIACMAVDEAGPNEGLALKRFYERFGFEQVGRLKGVGYKFGRWIDTIYMQLIL